MVAYRPLWPFRLFGLAKWSLDLNERGLRLDDDGWAWDQLQSCRLEEGWLSSVVVLNGKRRIRLRGVSRIGARTLLELSQVAKHIGTAEAQIAKYLTSSWFISENDRRSLLQSVQKEIRWGDLDGPVRYLKQIPVLQAEYAHVRRYLSGDRSELGARNAKFVAAELKSWSDWFAHGEKTPLTEEQARAVVVMEDRNLLVAAAGSGKTSTIVAKAAYALAKGYCEPNELLVLTFNRRIREELKERLQKRLSAVNLPTEIVVETFNAFGYQQVKRLNRNSRLAPWAAVQSKEIAHLTSLTNALVKRSPQFAQALAEFAAIWFESDEKEEGEILAATEVGSLEEAMRRLFCRAAPEGAVPTYTTLDGKTVRSLQELRICNWLALMGVEYEYERPFEQSLVPSDWTSGYRPDFYYPAINCWHEHFGLNKLGKAPPWFSRPKTGRSYEVEVVHKREVLRRSGVDWFETKSADFEDGTWQQILQEELKLRGLAASFIGWEPLSKDFAVVEFVTKDIVQLVLSCLRHAKSNRLSPSDIERVMGTGAHRARAFLRIFKPIFEAYENDLRERGDLDFEDMVILSANAFREGRLHHPYRLILVDEFQDVSNSRAELISAMLSQSPDIRLFGVGDDWQSIYRFAGADITAMTQFDKRYGYTAKNHLTRTFRSNQFIADAASKFIQKNPAQLRKEIVAASPGSPTSIEVVFHTGEPKSFLDDELELLARRHQGPRKLSIFMLGRYNFLKPESLDTWQKAYQDKFEISFLTIHKAKGLEADVVFLLGASNKKGQDFPSTIQDDPLLMLFMPNPDQMAWAEERRLFYVALTRARDKAYIVSPEGQASLFVSELVSIGPVSQSLYSGNEKNAVEDAKPFLRLPQCPRCKDGSIMRRTGKFGPFEFCTRKCGYKRNLKVRLI